jgi:cysteine-rich repeat protein
MAYVDPSSGSALHDGSPLAGAVPTIDGPPVFDRWFPSSTNDLGTMIPYSNPFDSPLTVVDRYILRSRRVTLPHASSTIDVLEGKADRRALMPALGLTPLVLPPAHVMLDGSESVAGVRAPPQAPLQLRWDPAPHATFYDVGVEHVFVDGTTPRIVETARLRTADPFAAIPPDLISAGERYELRITSVTTSAAYADGALRRTALPTGSAEVVTGILLFSATCGNGRVDPGEDCDTRGASPTCDVDCTFPVCGDGLVNKAAGEACDAAEGYCSPGCTTPACGDGYLDPSDYSFEQCDDGNQVSGDGCSSCRLEYHCLDGIKNAYEACDDGNFDNTDGCRNDCTLPRCGDGIVDGARGEQCDDGNTISGDGCSATCQIEPPPS